MTMVFLLMVPVLAFVAWRLTRANRTVRQILAEELSGRPVPVRHTGTFDMTAVPVIPGGVTDTARKEVRPVGSP